MSLPPFETELYYAEYEFTSPHLLSVSDCESMSVGELLKLADVDPNELLSQTLQYTESQGNPRLRQRIADRYEGLAPDQVLLLNSPIEGLYLLSKVFTGRTIVLLPAYDALKNLPQNAVGWELRAAEGRWELDWEALEELAREPVELLVVNFPHNPTGFLPSLQEWERLVKWAHDRGIWLFCDEMYRGLPLRHPGLPSVVEVYEKGITLSGLSKPQGLPGLRAGWLISRDAEILRKLFEMRLYTSICTASPIEFLAEVALSVEQQLLERSQALVRRNVALANKFFNRHPEFGWRKPLGGSVALVELPEGIGAEAYCRKLASEKGIVLLPSSFLGIEDRYVRFGFGRESFAAALRAYELAGARATD
ncbi:MAG: aminotransferase class I/II-fold pyridoxal phosphate-dependent enzyme [Candidatus Eremiobacteraeota bacterium]|nr:aminotransferase class I/II-fold pyridoxal phosphate-dependent enzyme [Candidatus Eremiobacteraeota bacterium]